MAKSPSAVRRRRKNQQEAKLLAQSETANNKVRSIGRHGHGSKWLTRASCALVCLLSCLFICHYARWSLENTLWFSNIQEVEREISMRTERGFYYSYYKQLLQAPSLFQGLIDLTVDNATENRNTVNILGRFNIYQEVILAALYRNFIPANFLSPIYFYNYSFFFLGGVGLATVCLITYATTGSAIASALCFAFFINNLKLATRVVDFPNLRENCSIPFFWMQNLVVCLYLRQGCRTKSHWPFPIAITLLSFLFATFWQFNQFLLFVQAIALYLLTLLKLVPVKVLFNVYLGHLIAVGCLCLAQFGQTTLLGSVVVSFIVAALSSLSLFGHWTHSGGIVAGLFKTSAQALCTVFFTLIVKVALATILNLRADNHIYKFLLSKFGMLGARDFESRLYLCHSGFTFLSHEFFVQTSETTLFPLYTMMVVGSLFVVGKNLLIKWCDLNALCDPAKSSSPKLLSTDFFANRPDIAFLVIESAIFGLISILVSRVQYLWVPLMCVLASTLLGSSEIWKSVITWNSIRCRVNLQIFQSTLMLSLVIYNAVGFYPHYKDMMNLRLEFWDPDTVQLMYWIGNSTSPRAVFTGSMQLMAAVKCSTGRHITNHPHFEDYQLRQRTKDLYQIYGKRTEEEVYRILKKYDVNYIILEDSICYESSKRGCALREIIDLENGHALDEPIDDPAVQGLANTPVPRFCQAIMEQGGSFSRYFRLIFKNRTFKVYQLF